MSWSFSRVQVEEYLAVCSSDTDASAPLNTTPMPDQFYWPDKPTEHSRLSRFGMTCVPLTGNLGEGLLTWYLEDFHAKTFRAQEKAQESPESEADCGKKWRGSLAKYDPDTHSLKTAQCSLIEDLTGCSVTLPRWGLMQDGELYPHQIPALSTKEIEYGFWPTPRAQEPGSTTQGFGRGLAELVEGRSQKVITIYPTPTAHNAKECNAPSESQRNTPTLGSIAGGRLNPNWVEWLMGWPIGHTDLKPLETAKFQEFMLQHSLNYNEG